MPAFRGRISGGFQHIGNSSIGRDGGDSRGNGGFTSAVHIGGRHKADQLDAIIIAQHFNRKTRGNRGAGKRHLKTVPHAGGIYHRPCQVDGAKARGLIRRGAIQHNLQAIRRRCGPGDTFGHQRGIDRRSRAVFNDQRHQIRGQQRQQKRARKGSHGDGVMGQAHIGRALGMGYCGLG